MGLYDNLRCDVPLPDTRLPSGNTFQTKSLRRSMDSFTITRDGRLVHHMRDWRMTPGARSGDTAPLIKAPPAGDVDIAFHGDIRFGDLDADNHYVEYVARFTNGTLEWIKPYEDLSKLEKAWLINTE